MFPLTTADYRNLFDDSSLPGSMEMMIEIEMHNSDKRLKVSME